MGFNQPKHILIPGVNRACVDYTFGKHCKLDEVSTKRLLIIYHQIQIVWLNTDKMKCIPDK